MRLARGVAADIRAKHDAVRRITAKVLHLALAVFVVWQVARREEERGGGLGGLAARCGQPQACGLLACWVGHGQTHAVLRTPGSGQQLDVAATTVQVLLVLCRELCDRGARQAKVILCGYREHGTAAGSCWK